MQPTTLDTIIKHLWPMTLQHHSRKVFAILDGARDEKIAPMVRASRLPFHCLFREPMTEDFRNVAPYLVELTAEADFTQQLLEQGWGQS